MSPGPKPTPHVGVAVSVSFTGACGKTSGESLITLELDDPPPGSPEKINVRIESPPPPAQKVHLRLLSQAIQAMWDEARIEVVTLPDPRNPTHQIIQSIKRVP